MTRRKFDFDRIALLFEVGEKARAHGPAYGNIVAAVDAELREINAGRPDEPRGPTVVTPPAGPASSLLVNPDGSSRQINDPQLSPADRPPNVEPGYDTTADLRGVQQPMPNTVERETPPQPRSIPPADPGPVSEPVERKV